MTSLLAYQELIIVLKFLVFKLENSSNVISDNPYTESPKDDIKYLEVLTKSIDIINMKVDTIFSIFILLRLIRVYSKKILREKHPLFIHLIK